MKRILFFVGIAVTAFTRQATADFKLPSHVTYQGHDLTQLVQHLAENVNELKHPYYFYHWFEGDNSKGAWDHITRSDDDTGYRRAMGAALSYWNNYGISTWSMYGYGLYFAIDPLVTQGYGGSNFWVLLQAQLPKGLRYLNLANGTQALTNEDIAIFQNFNCPTIYAGNALNTLFAAARLPANPACKSFLTKIFDDVLKIDGFFYSYAASNFPGIENCRQQTLQPAFVLTSNRKIQKNAVRIFTKNTNNDLTSRILIQSLLTRPYSGPPIPSNSSTYTGYGSYNPFPKNFAESPSNILWDDLKDQPTTPDVDSWIRENLFTCSGNG